MKLEGKTAIITGAASGIGKSIALYFAREGANVAIADLRLDAAEAAAKEIRTAKGVAMGVAMDVSDEKAVNDGVAAVVKEFGGVDILVSNAGIQIVHPIEAFPFADWKKMLAIHLDGAFLTTKACLPHMYKSGRGGSIIYMGSVHSKEASLLESAYVTSKHAVIGMMKSAAKECAHMNIRVNTVNPSPVETRMMRSLEEGFAPGDAEAARERMRANIPLGRYGEPEDIAIKPDRAVEVRHAQVDVSDTGGGGGVIRCCHGRVLLFTPS